MTRAATHHAREGSQEDAEQVRPCLKCVEIQVEGEAHAPGQDHAEWDDQHRNLWGVCVCLCVCACVCVGGGLGSGLG